ncbi:GTP-binding protein Rho1 [Chytridiales sp. JEL 0842]|nr:GTP-binding protein Rho1 [Chytridiales sp. JEL 0842]
MRSSDQYDQDAVDQLRIRKKLVIVGDGFCGKTALLMVHSGLKFPENYQPTIFENYISRIQVNSKQTVELSLWDTAGQEEYDRLRPLSYPGSDIVLMTFSIAAPETCWNIRDRWSPEINHFLKDAPRIVVGLKKDLRSDMNIITELKKANQKPITPEEGEKIAKEVGAERYMECSARSGEGVEEIFTLAAKISLKARKKSTLNEMLAPEEDSMEGKDIPLKPEGQQEYALKQVYNRFIRNT